MPTGSYERVLSSNGLALKGGQIWTPAEGYDLMANDKVKPEIKALHQQKVTEAYKYGRAVVDLNNRQGIEYAMALGPEAIIRLQTPFLRTNSVDFGGYKAPPFQEVYATITTDTVYPGESNHKGQLEPKGRLRLAASMGIVAATVNGRQYPAAWIPQGYDPLMHDIARAEKLPDVIVKDLSLACQMGTVGDHDSNLDKADPRHGTEAMVLLLPGTYAHKQIAQRHGADIQEQERQLLPVTAARTPDAKGVLIGAPFWFSRPIFNIDSQTPYKMVITPVTLSHRANKPDMLKEQQLEMYDNLMDLLPVGVAEDGMKQMTNQDLNK